MHTILLTFFCLGQSFALGPKNIFKIIHEYGFYGENHTVVTEDGYILTTHRVCKDSCQNKVPVFVQHGVYNTAEHFLILGPERSLGFVLANNGYDVWLGNSRGTKFSRKHQTLNPNWNAKFWKFSFHEMGVYDLPANIDYILGVTGKKQLYYVGHSQGTSSFYAMGSTRPEYNEKIKAQFSLSCVAHMKHIHNPQYQLLARLLPLENFVEFFFQYDPFFYDIRVPLSLTNLIGDVFCSDLSPTQWFCKEAMVALFGFSNRELNSSTIPTILTYTPSECSWRQVTHYLQLINSGYFRQFDYGKKENLKRYNSTEPPIYNLAKITAPVYLFLGKSDFFANLDDVKSHTIPSFGNLKKQYIMPYDSFAHNDFVTGIDIPTLVFKRILCLLNAYETNKEINCE